MTTDRTNDRQRRDEAFQARRSASSAILLLFLILLILLLIAAATERTDTLKVAGAAALSLA